MSYHFLFQGIFLTQGLNPSLLHWKADSLPLSHLGSPLVKLLMAFFHSTRTKNFTICMEHKKTSNSKSNLEKKKQKNGAAGIRLPDLRLCSLTSACTIFLYKNRNMDQWSRIHNPEISPQAYDHLIYDKGGRNTQWRKDSLFNKWCWEIR